VSPCAPGTRADVVEPTSQVSEHLARHPRSYAGGVDELAVVSVVAEEKRTHRCNRRNRKRNKNHDP
jgi:hypothetical protein